MKRIHMLIYMATLSTALTGCHREKGSSAGNTLAQCSDTVDNDGDGISCSDRNACADPERNGCDTNAVCTNIENRGGYACACDNGYFGDGLTCFPLSCVRCVDIEPAVTNPDGVSWTTAFTTVQEGIAWATYPK